MANTTQRVLAMSLKRLLTRMPLDKISIQALVDDAEVSRKTFYYHFKDIYDLLEWMVTDEGKRVLEGRVSADTWQEGMEGIFDYLRENRTMILNLYRPLERDGDLLAEHISRMVLPLLEQVFDAQPGHEKMTPEDRQFILDLYSFGLVKLFLRWIGNGMKPDAADMMVKVEHLLSGSMESLIRRWVGEEASTAP
jgi:AcrR family transcriptional regulator